MMQDINLLSTLSPQPRGYLRARNLLVCVGGWFLLLMLIYGIWWGLTVKLQAELNTLKANKQNVEQQFIFVNRDFAEQALSQQTASNKASATKFLITKNSMGFSRCLDGLAKTTPRGIWLQTVQFSNIDNSIVLIGNSLAAAFIPEFLHNMATARVFFGKKFNVLRITKIEQGKDKSSITFELAANRKRTS